MLRTYYEDMGCRMNLKIRFLYSHLNFFPQNLAAVSDEHWVRFHQDIMKMEANYRGKWSPCMTADFCWMLKRSLNVTSPMRDIGYRLKRVIFDFLLQYSVYSAILLYLFSPRTLAIPFLFVLSCFRYRNKLKFELYTLKWDYGARIIQFTMRAKITSIYMCAAFSLRRAAFLRKCSINRKLDAIEKNGQRIRKQHPKIS